MAARRTKKKRTARATSNVFARFDESQISEFQEAFKVITNNEGFITSDNLREILGSLSTSEPSEDYIAEMMSDAPDSSEKINWIMFLTLFAEKMEGMDAEDTIRNAFACFDPAGQGAIPESQLREILTTMGDKRMTDDEVDEMLRDGPFDKTGNFDYKQFTRLLKTGNKDL